MYLKMDGYPDSLCYQNTALSCVMCSDTYLIKSTSECLKRDRDGCMPSHVYWYRLTVCSKCTKSMKNFSVPVSYTMFANTNAVTNSTGYKGVCRYFRVIPRLYSLGKLHVVYSVDMVRHNISSVAYIEKMNLDEKITTTVCTIEDI